MKYYELDKEEQQILKDFEVGKYKPVRNLNQEIKKIQQAARATLNKTKNINVRITEKDLYKVKAKAVDKGIPYQTLITSIIHQYSNDKVKELA